MSSLLKIPELFCISTEYLHNQEKIFLISCSKTIYNYKSLLKFDSTYDLSIIYNCWCISNMKKIIINKLINSPDFEEKIKELMMDSKSIKTNSKCISWISSNTKIKLFYSKTHKIIPLAVSSGLDYIGMRMMLRNSYPKKEKMNKILSMCAKNGYFSIGKLLIDEGADVQALHNGAILLAAKYGHLNMVKLFLDKGANIEARCGDDNTPFLLASGNGHLDIVKLLIDEGADIQATNINDWDALTFATACGHLEMVKLLVNYIKIEYNSLIVNATHRGRLSIVKFFIDNGGNVQAQNNSAIILASYSGHLEMMELLINNGANVQAQDNEAIISAARKGYYPAVKFLIEKGADVQAQNNSALVLASYCNLKTVKLLIENGANVQARDNQAIINASRAGHLPIVKLLIENGANVQARDIKQL